MGRCSLGRSLRAGRSPALVPEACRVVRQRGRRQCSSAAIVVTRPSGWAPSSRRTMARAQLRCPSQRVCRASGLARRALRTALSPYSIRNILYRQSPRLVSERRPNLITLRTQLRPAEGCSTAAAARPGRYEPTAPQAPSDPHQPFAIRALHAVPGRHPCGPQPRAGTSSAVNARRRAIRRHHGVRQRGSRTVPGLRGRRGAHVGAQAGLVHHRDVPRAGWRRASR